MEDYDEDLGRDHFSEADLEKAMEDLASSRLKIIKRKNHLKALKNLSVTQSEDNLYKFLHEGED
jgi:hypothetical protein